MFKSCIWQHTHVQIPFWRWDLQLGTHTMGKIGSFMFLCSMLQQHTRFPFVRERTARPDNFHGAVGFKPLTWDQLIDQNNNRPWTDLERLGYFEYLRCCNNISVILQNGSRWYSISFKIVVARLKLEPWTPCSAKQRAKPPQYLHSMTCHIYNRNIVACDVKQQSSYLISHSITLITYMPILPWGRPWMALFSRVPIFVDWAKITHLWGSKLGP